MAVIATPPFLYFTDDDGNPLSGGKIWTYRAGTSQLKNTFTDQSETTPATNPIVLDSAGRAVVWISGSYKFVITDAFDNIIRTVDNVTSFNVFQNEADSFFESLSGDGVETTFSLSSDLGTDENAIFVFTDNGMTNHVRNGGFDTDTIWTKGSGWSIGSGVATAAGAISTAIEQNSNITLNAGQAYVVTFTMTRDAGNLTASVGGTAGTARNAAGTYTEIIIAGSTQALAFTGGGFTGTLDDVSIKPVMSSGANIVPPTQFTLNGTSITFANPPGDGTNNISVFAPSLLVASAAGSAAAAEQSADNAATSETKAAQSASDASDSADLAESWAIGDAIDRPEGSAKAWADTASAVTIPPGSITTAKYADESVTEPKLSDEAVSLRTLTAALVQAVASRDIRGGVISNGTNTEHDIDVTALSCLDSTFSKFMSVGAITKALDATFAEGNGNGGMASGEELPTNGTIHIWATTKADGTGDVFANNHATSGLSPTPPSGFVNIRYLYSLRTDASANIINGVMSGKDWWYNSWQQDFNDTTPAATRTLIAMAVPSGYEHIGHFEAEAINGSAFAAWFDSANHTDIAPSTTGGGAGSNTRDLRCESASTTAQKSKSILTDVDGQIAYRASGTSVNTFEIDTRGYTNMARGVL